MRLNELKAAEEVREFYLRVLFGVGAVDCVLADGVRELFAQRALVRLRGVGRAHQVAPSLDRVLLLQSHYDARPGRHEDRQLAEEGALAVNLVEAFGLGLRQVYELQRAKLEARVEG